MYRRDFVKTVVTAFAVTCGVNVPRTCDIDDIIIAESSYVMGVYDFYIRDEVSNRYAYFQSSGDWTVFHGFFDKLPYEVIRPQQDYWTNDANSIHNK